MANKTNKQFIESIDAGIRAEVGADVDMAAAVALPIARTTNIVQALAEIYSPEVKTGDDTGPFFVLRRKVSRHDKGAGRKVKISRAKDGTVTVKVAKLEDVTTDNGWSAADEKKAKKALEPKDDSRAPQQGKGPKGGDSSDSSAVTAPESSAKTYAALNALNQQAEDRRALEAIFERIAKHGRDPLEQVAKVSGLAAEMAEDMVDRIADQQASQNKGAA